MKYFTFCNISQFYNCFYIQNYTKNQMRRKSNIQTHNNFLNRYRSPHSKNKSKGKIKLTQHNEIKNLPTPAIYCGSKNVYPNQDSNYSSTNHTMIIRPSASFVNMYRGSAISKNTSQKTVKNKKYTKQGKHKVNNSSKDVEKKQIKEKIKKPKIQQNSFKNIKESEKQIIMMILNQSATKIQRFWRKHQLKIKTQRRQKIYALPQQLQYPQSQQSSISPVYARQNSNTSTHRQYKDCQLNQQEIHNFFNEPQSAKVLFPPEIEDQESLLSPQIKGLQNYKIFEVKKRFLLEDNSNLSRNHFRTSSESADSLIPTPYGKIQQPIYNNGKYINIDKKSKQKYENKKKFEQEFSEQSQIEEMQRCIKEKSVNSSYQRKKIKTQQLVYQDKKQVMKTYASVESGLKKINKLAYSNVYCMTITRSPISHTPYEDSYPQELPLKYSYPFEHELKQCKKKLAQSKLHKLLSLEDKLRNQAITQRSYERSMKDVSQQYQRNLQIIQGKHKKLLAGWQQIFAISENFEKKPSKQILEEQTHLICSNTSIANHRSKASQQFTQQKRSQKNFKKNKQNIMTKQQSYVNQSLQKNEYANIPKVCIQLGPINEDNRAYSNKAILKNQSPKSKSNAEYCQFQYDTNIYGKKNNQLNENIGSLEHHLSPIYVNTVSLQNSAKASSGRSFNILGDQEGTIKSLIDKLDQQPQLENIISFQSLIHLDAGIKSDKILKKDNDVERQFEKVQKIKPKSFDAIQKSKEDQMKWNQHTKIVEWVLNQLIIQFVNPSKKEKTKKLSISNMLKMLRENNNSPIVQNYHKSNVMMIKNSSSQSEEEDHKNQIISKKIKDKSQTIDDNSYDSIVADIDSVNNWLLQISYFLLDHYSDEILINLTQTSQKQPSPQQLMRMVKNKTGDQFMENYQVITDRMFQQFEFIYMRKVAETVGIKSQRYESFSRLLLCFHRALFDCLNLALLYQLSSGRDWLNLPWTNKRKIIKPIKPDHAKMSLQRGINKVSNMAQYLIAPLRMYNNDFSEYQWKIYNQNRVSMTIHLQILQVDVKSQIWVGQLINKIYLEIQKEQLFSVAQQLVKISANNF